MCPLANIWKVRQKHFPLDSNWLICLLRQQLKPSLALQVSATVLSSNNDHLSPACPGCFDNSERVFMQHAIQVFRQHILLVFFFWKGLKGSWRQKKRDSFWHTALKLEPAVSQQRQQVVIFLLQFFAAMGTGWKIWGKKRGKKGKPTSMDGTTTRDKMAGKNSKNVNLRTAFLTTLLK